MNPIRVVIPVNKFGSETYECIKAAAKSLPVGSCEIVVVINGTDFPAKQPLTYPNVSFLVSTEIASAAYARNCGAADFLSGVLVFIDSDVICEKNCIDRLIKPILNGDSEAAVGNYSAQVSDLSFFQKFKQLYLHFIYGRRNGLLKNDFWSALSAIRADIFHNLKGFNVHYEGANGEDREIGIRLTRHNYRTIAVPDAVGLHLHKFSLRGIISNDFKKGVGAVLNGLSNNIPLSDDRHVTSKDKIAAFSSCLLPAVSIAAVLRSQALWGLLILLSAWLISRSELLLYFKKKQGILFSLKTAILMFVLDIVRTACIPAGYSKYYLNRWTRKNRSSGWDRRATECNL